MNLDNARNLKFEIFRKVFGYEQIVSASLAGEPPAFVHPKAIEAASASGSYSSPEMGFAIGIAADRASHGSNSPDPQLAVLVRDRRLLSSALMDSIVREARGEVTKIFVGRPRAQAYPQDRERPLRIGCSLGHKRVTAGSLGCFVKTDAQPRAILSNNHVLARANAASIGDAILQPGKADGGRDPDDRIGTLLAFSPLALGPADTNFTDCALAGIFPDVEIDQHRLPAGSPVERLSGKLREPMLDMPVWKTGRSTALTEGVVDIIEVDQLLVDFGAGGSRRVLRFDRQMAVSGSGVGAFSKPGDSGSLIYETEGYAVGLLFAGSPDGGRNGRGMTFANPIGAVLDALDAEIVV